MSATESFEIAASNFKAASGHLAPGKDGCTRSPECMHDWNIWCAAIEYMKKCADENKKLRELLADYGSHNEGCSAAIDNAYTCKCGWDRERKILEIDKP